MGVAENDNAYGRQWIKNRKTILYSSTAATVMWVKF